MTSADTLARVVELARETGPSEAPDIRALVTLRLMDAGALDEASAAFLADELLDGFRIVPREPA